MPIPQSKNDLLIAIKKDSEKLFTAFEMLSETDWHKQILVGNIRGTLITSHNLLAYQVGWATLLLNWYQKGLQKEVFSMPMEGFKWNELGKLASYFHSQYANYSPEELLQRFRQLVKEVIVLVETLSNEQLYTVGVYQWTGQYTLGRYIQLNTSSPYRNAYLKLGTLVRIKK